MVAIIDQILVPAITQLLGVILFLAGVLKLLDIASTRKTVDAFEIVPAEWSKRVGLAVSVLELLLAIGLVSGVASSSASFVAGAAFLLFTGIQASAVWRGLKVACGCFGSAAPELVGKRTILRTGLLVGLCFAAGSLGVAVVAKSNCPDHSVFLEYVVRAVATLAILQFLSFRQSQDNFALEGISSHLAGRVSRPD